MTALFRYFVDLCLLRAVPQQLPPSVEVFWMALVASLGSATLVIGQARASLFRALLEGLVDAGLMLGALALALRLWGQSPRWLQTATALLGSGALLGVLALPLLRWSGRDAPVTALAEFSGLLLLLLLVWNMVVYGHVLRHAFGVSLGLGVTASILYSLLSYLAMTQLFPLT